MSTKSSLASGPNFHFYSEAFDDDHVYLELEHCRFEASNQHVVVGIPIAIWEAIRQHSIVDFSFADKTDAELQEYVEAEVQCRVAQFAQADDRRKSILNLSGVIVYGLADSPKEEQIAKGLNYFKERRTHQATIRKDAETLKSQN